MTGIINSPISVADPCRMSSGILKRSDPVGLESCSANSNMKPSKKGNAKSIPINGPMVKKEIKETSKANKADVAGLCDAGSEK